MRRVVILLVVVVLALAISLLGCKTSGDDSETAGANLDSKAKAKTLGGCTAPGVGPEETSSGPQQGAKCGD